jgi:hydrogenase expression/formation protein HypE
MKKDNDRILPGHGSGGSMMHLLIDHLFIARFGNKVLNRRSDAAILKSQAGMMAFTTDSFVVDPLFFPGGNIGTLAVCGTINDLVAEGAVPYCLSAAFIIEEGFPLKELETIVDSMAEEAENAGVFIATGDTKVVEKGKCDKLFINTSGVGFFRKDHPMDPAESNTIKAGDKIIITGYIGDHGMAVMAARNKLEESISFTSDCASLNHMLTGICDDPGGIRFMRDPTRGGLATTLCELTRQIDFGIVIHERNIPVRPAVQGFCDLFGFDPLYVANEGKMVIVADPVKAPLIIDKLHRHPLGRHACIIGEVTPKNKHTVGMITHIGGTRIINMQAGEQLPRIC